MSHDVTCHVTAMSRASSSSLKRKEKKRKTKFLYSQKIKEKENKNCLCPKCLITLLYFSLYHMIVMRQKYGQTLGLGLRYSSSNY